MAIGARESPLGAFIRRRMHDIVDAWAHAARAELRSAVHVDRPALVDHLPPMLLRIADMADGLRAGQELVEPSELATKHALERLEVGFDMSEVMREYVLLRETVLRLWNEEARTLDFDSVTLLSRAVDVAAATAMQQYLGIRSRMLESLEAISLAAFTSGTLDELLGRLLRAFISCSPAADTAALYLEEGDVLRRHAAVGLEAGLDLGAEVRVGQGLIGEVAARREARIVEHPAGETLLAGTPLAAGMVSSLLALPLADHDLVGVAYVGSMRGHALSRQDQWLFRTLASRATSVIGKVLLREEAELRARQQLAVARFGERAILTKDLRLLYDDAVSTVAETLGVELSDLLELDVSGAEMLVCAGVGHGEGVVGHVRERIDAGTIVGRALAGGGPVVVEDVSADPCAAPVYLRAHAVTSAAAVVIRATGDEGQPFGLLVVSSRTRRSFSEDALAFLQAMANMLGGAIARRRAEWRMHEAEEAQRFLAEAGRRLSESLDRDLTLNTVAELAIERLADWCVIDLIERDAIRRAVVVHRDPQKVELARSLGAFHPARGDASPSGRVIQSGDPELVSRVDIDALRATRSEEQLAIIRSLGIRSYLCVPIVSRGKAIGALTLVSAESGRRFGAFHLLVAQELARRAGLAIENAELYEESQAAIARRQEILAVVSHDLRSPLGTVQMAAELIGDETPEAKTHVERILRSTKHMERLIRDLLDLASLEGGRLTVELGAHRPEKLAHEAVDAARAPAEQQGVRIGCDAEPGLPDVRADRDRVLQVLSNLVSNAIRATPRGGSIEVRVGRETDREVRVSVVDTGTGIAPEDQRRLFDPHFRGKNARYAGTGRGLAIAKGIVEAHGGRLWLESELDAGSAFHFTLPAV